jgi:deazaflavin-dependent oxidoreductase (nitroreductase family)
MLTSLFDQRTRRNETATGGHRMNRSKSWTIKIASQTHQMLYRALRGRLVAHLGEAQFLLLTTTGRRSGRRHTVPLLYLADNGSYALVGSYGGNPKAPAWLLNIRSDSHVYMNVRGQRIPGAARIATDSERARLWPEFVSVFPNYDRYQAKTTRRIPIVIVEPQPE